MCVTTVLFLSSMWFFEILVLFVVHEFVIFCKSFIICAPLDFIDDSPVWRCIRCLWLPYCWFWEALGELKVSYFALFRLVHRIILKQIVAVLVISLWYLFWEMFNHRQRTTLLWLTFLTQNKNLIEMTRTATIYFGVNWSSIHNCMSHQLPSR